MIKIGTRSTIKFFGEVIGNVGIKQMPLLSIYQQWDGYPTSVGIELLHFLKKCKICSGINGKSSSDARRSGKHLVNGMGCLSATFLANIKKSVGSVYCTKPDDIQEWNYEVYPHMVKNGGMVEFRQEYYLRIITEDGNVVFEDYTSNITDEVMEKIEVE